VQRVVDAAAPGGGFICSTACSVAPHVKPENIKVMVDVARAYKYQ
jgi:uroporphyrinogen-III decarboxylase